MADINLVNARRWKRIPRSWSRTSACSRRSLLSTISRLRKRRSRLKLFSSRQKITRWKSSAWHFVCLCFHAWCRSFCICVRSYVVDERCLFNIYINGWIRGPSISKFVVLECKLARLCYYCVVRKVSILEPHFPRDVLVLHPSKVENDKGILYRNWIDKFLWTATFGCLVKSGEVLHYRLIQTPDKPCFYSSYDNWRKWKRTCLFLRGRCSFKPFLCNKQTGWNTQ